MFAMHVMITGGAGFFGFHGAEALPGSTGAVSSLTAGFA